MKQDILLVQSHRCCLEVELSRAFAGPRLGQETLELQKAPPRSFRQPSAKLSSSYYDGSHSSLVSLARPFT